VVRSYRGCLMATGGKSKKKGQAKPPAPRRSGDPPVAAMLGDGSKSDETQELPRPTIRELAVEYLKHPDEWLDHPHPGFGGRTPNELIAAGEEEKLYNMFRRFELGLF
jgi:hypothetical protein